MTSHLGIFCAAALAVAATPVWAQDPVVVELFTSQGCSACPPADALLNDLAERDGVIALALHVDYWDYIGWSDTFAERDFGQRQHNYAHAAGSTVVYTPQMVIGGQDHIVGNRTMEVMDAIAAHRSVANPVSIEALATQAGWQIRADWIGEGQAPEMVVQLVSYSPQEHVEITHGENEGRSATYSNVVRSWTVVSNWSGAQAFEGEVNAQGDLPHVVIVQTDGYGPILGAARLD